MDFVNKFTGGDSGKDSNNQSENKEGQSSGGFMDKLNGMAGGGEKGEKNEDSLDKAVDFVQENVLGQGQQSNENAAEQAKDEAISDYIRDQYKSTTGTDFPIEDKDKKYGV
ncbi:uncharacterized protein F5Z01DRAFT_206261 [Emericellopsis atlantica]|uniref:DNA damage-responsive protein 48 n=1 Tax=Emericellopsis atlantica TaxID=2614577 RepID=A0A9P7ZVK2_9HYPO|nr:uncharacterized protein F5Z01DRAFT_206261 [Emericellopsis atlantica]KAG9258621.1 hypothetical protein F5Z01DRAFT_206261 [Emericellopsis atlantica]